MEPSHSRTGRLQVYDWFPIPKDIVLLARLHVSWHAKGQAHPTLNLPNGYNQLFVPNGSNHWQSRPPKLTTCAAQTGITWSARCNSIGNRFVMVCSDATINCLPSWGCSGHIPRKSWFTKMRTRQVTIRRCSRGKGFCDRKHAV